MSGIALAIRARSIAFDLFIYCWDCIIIDIDYLKSLLSLWKMWRRLRMALVLMFFSIPVTTFSFIFFPLRRSTHLTASRLISDHSLIANLLTGEDDPFYCGFSMLMSRVSDEDEVDNGVKSHFRSQPVNSSSIATDASDDKRGVEAAGDAKRTTEWEDDSIALTSENDEDFEEMAFAHPPPPQPTNDHTDSVIVVLKSGSDTEDSPDFPSSSSNSSPLSSSPPSSPPPPSTPPPPITDDTFVALRRLGYNRQEVASMKETVKRLVLKEQLPRNSLPSTSSLPPSWLLPQYRSTPSSPREQMGSETGSTVKSSKWRGVKVISNSESESFNPLSPKPKSLPSPTNADSTKLAPIWPLSEDMQEMLLDEAQFRISLFGDWMIPLVRRESRWRLTVYEQWLAFLDQGLIRDEEEDEEEDEEVWRKSKTERVTRDRQGGVEVEVLKDTEDFVTEDERKTDTETPIVGDNQTRGSGRERETETLREVDMNRQRRSQRPAQQSSQSERKIDKKAERENKADRYEQYVASRAHCGNEYIAKTSSVDITNGERESDRDKWLSETETKREAQRKTKPTTENIRKRDRLTKEELFAEDDDEERDREQVDREEEEILARRIGWRTSSRSSLSNPAFVEDTKVPRSFETELRNGDRQIDDRSSTRSVTRGVEKYRDDSDDY